MLSDAWRHWFNDKIIRIHRKWMRAFYDLPPIKLELQFPSLAEVIDPILDDCCLPPYLGPKDHDDYVPLMKIVNSLRPAIVLELGTAFGNTVANICNACKETRIFTVNALAEHQTGSLVTCELSREEIGRVYRAYGFEDRVTQIYQNTLELDLFKYFSGPLVDLAIIDACHDTAYVTNDFFKVKDFVRPGGLVLFHDTYPSTGTHLEGSYMACMQLRRKGYDIHHIPDTWWAVWRQEKSDNRSIAPRIP